MNNLHYLRFLLLAIIFINILNSCNLSKQNEIACPEFKNEKPKSIAKLKNPDWFRFLKNNKSKPVHSQRRDYENITMTSAPEAKNDYLENRIENKYFEVIAEKCIIPLIKAHSSKGTQNAIASKPKKEINKPIFNKLDTIPVQNCDTIVLKSGIMIATTNIIIENQTIKFKTCFSQKGSISVLTKELVNKIKYHDGTETIMKSPKKINSLGLIAFIFALVSSPILWFFGIINIWLTLILCPLSIIFSIISLYQLKKNPGKYSGKWISIVALILGLITGGIILLFIANPPL